MVTLLLELDEILKEFVEILKIIRIGVIFFRKNGKTGLREKMGISWKDILETKSKDWDSPYQIKINFIRNL